MITIMEKYTEAVIQKKPELLPLAENVRATFNGVECAVGDNPMWKNTLVMPERQTFIDTVTGEMVLFGTTNNETVERNFDFPIEGIECLYDLWLVPTSFPDGRFNVNAQVLNSNNIRVGELTFSRADNLKDLLRKCPNQGDFMVIEDLLDIERFFDHPSNKLDIRGYIKPVKEVPAKKRRNRKS